MTKLNRWKLASILLAGVAGYALFLRGPADNAPASEAIAAHRDGALPAHFRRPLRLSAEAAGISKSELVDRMLAAKTVKDVQVLAEKLAIIGDDQSIAGVRPLLADPRRGVPEAVIGAIGKIGTERAVDLLIDLANDDRTAVRYAAILALGQTQSRAAEKELTALARKPGDSARGYAIAALGQLGSDQAVDVLVELATGNDPLMAVPAVQSLGAIATGAARKHLRALVDAPDARVAAAALASIDPVDDELATRLIQIVKSGDPHLGNAAITALAKAGEVGLPALRSVALEGNQLVRFAAVQSIGQIGGAKALATLGELLELGDRTTAVATATALAAIGGKEARELLINSALSDRAQITGALVQLAALEGEDVDAALLKVMKEGSAADRKIALPRLLRTGNEDALRVAIELAQRGSRNERLEAMRLLAEAPSPKAWDILIDIAGKSRGPSRVAALDLLAAKRPTDPALEALLADSLFSGRRDEATYAASVLGRLNTEQSRTTLITALQGSDKQLALAAAGALGQTAMTDRVKSLLLAAARDNDQIKMQVMHQLINAGAPEGLRLADEVLSGKDGAHAAGVIHAIAQMGGAEAKRLIERAMSSSDPAVRVAAISTLATNPDDRSTDTLLRLTRDNDPQVRAIAISTLGQVGSPRAQQAIIDTAGSGKPDEKMAAIPALATIDDPRAGQTLARLMRDPDPGVAAVAIASGYNGGAEVDQTLISIVNDPAVADDLKIAAAGQLRARLTDLDEATDQVVTKMAGSAAIYGGYGYGGLVMPMIEPAMEQPAIDI